MATGTSFQPLKPGDLENPRRMEQYVLGLERALQSTIREVEALRQATESVDTELTSEDFQAIKAELESGGSAELDLTNLLGVSAENMDVRFRVVISAPDPYDASYDTYLLDAGGTYTLYQIDREQNPPVAVQIGLTANHNLLSATHPDTVAAAVVRGDLVVGNSTPKWARLPKGTANQAFRMDSSGNDPGWGSLADAALSANVALLNRDPQTFTGSQVFDNQIDISHELLISSVAVVSSASSPYTVAAGIAIVAVNTSTGAVTVNLPATVELYRVIIVYDVSGNAAANNITISGNGHTINGAASVVVNVAYAGKWIQGSGSNYSIIGSIVP